MRDKPCTIQDAHRSSLSRCSIPHTMEFAADAMRGHKSAHSFATGPVIADPAVIQRHT